VANLFERLDQGRPAPPSKKAQESLPDPKLQRAQKLLNWLGRWPGSTIYMRDILQFGPYALRNPKKAIAAAEVLVKGGWLIPERTRRYDAHLWQIVRKPIALPTIST
jgi:hypothetical protein